MVLNFYLNFKNSIYITLNPVVFLKKDLNGFSCFFVTKGYVFVMILEIGEEREIYIEGYIYIERERI